MRLRKPNSNHDQVKSNVKFLKFKFIFFFLNRANDSNNLIKEENVSLIYTSFPTHFLAPPPTSQMQAFLKNLSTPLLSADAT